MGCTAAAKSIKWFKDPHANHNINSEGRLLRELWDAELVHQISSHPTVQRVVVLGTVCALELKAEGVNSGYGSLFASSLVRKLREDGIYTRPLGNVIYLMCGPCTPPHICSQLLVKLHRRLDEFHQAKGSLKSCTLWKPQYHFLSYLCCLDKEGWLRHLKFVKKNFSSKFIISVLGTFFRIWIYLWL